MLDDWYLVGRDEPAPTPREGRKRGSNQAVREGTRQKLEQAAEMWDATRTLTNAQLAGAVGLGVKRLSRGTDNDNPLLKARREAAADAKRTQQGRAVSPD